MADTKVITGKVRFSYAHVFEPHAMSETDAKKYSVAVLIPKKDKATIAKIEAAISAAYEIGKAAHKLPAFVACKKPLRDGDDEKPDDENYAGMMFFNASSKNKPQIVDADLNPILDREEFYSGCWGRISVNMFAYSTGSKGIAAGLNNIQKLEEGDRLSGGSTAAQDFGSDDDLM